MKISGIDHESIQNLLRLMVVCTHVCMQIGPKQAQIDPKQAQNRPKIRKNLNFDLALNQNGASWGRKSFLILANKCINLNGQVDPGWPNVAILKYCISNIALKTIFISKFVQQNMYFFSSVFNVLHLTLVHKVENHSLKKLV